MNNKKKDMNKLTKNLIIDISLLLTILSMIVIIGAAEQDIVGNGSINGNDAPIVLPNDIIPLPDKISIVPADITDYKVIPIFFVPNDLTPNPFALQAVDRQMQLIQRWYGEQLRNRTFTLEPAKIVIGNHPLAYYYGDCFPVRSQCNGGYGIRLWNNIFSDMDNLGYPLLSNRIVGVFFQDDGNGSTALSLMGGGRFLVSLDPFGDCLMKGCATRVSEGGTAHEFGHTLGLRHPIDEWEKSVMGPGLYNFPQVSFVNTNINPEFDRLYTSPFLNLPTDIKNGGFEDCLKFWSSSTKNAQCMSIGQRSGLSTFQLLPNDQAYQKVTQDVSSVGGKTYDFSGWLNIPNQTGNFSVQVKVIALSKSKSTLKTFTTKKYTTTSNGWERIAISMLMPSGTTYARIQITGQGKATVYVDDFDFHIAKDIPQRPLPLFYTDGDAVPTLQPELKWSDVTKATSFRVQVATDKAFDKPIVDVTVLSPVYTIPSGKLTYDIRYYWRIQAINGAGKSDWSPSWSFIPRLPDKYYNDEFEIPTLNTAWSWVREDASKWYFGGPQNLRSYGYLGITAQSGDLLGDRNNAKNLLLRNTPPGDFEETTIVNWWGVLGTNYQQGGLLIYQDDDNYIELAHAYNDSSKIQLRAEIDGNIVMQASVPNQGTAAGRAIMKIARVGTTYSGYYSPDGLTWKQLGQPITVNWPTPRMGLGAYGQINGQEIVAWFDWFRVATPTYNISSSISVTSPNGGEIWQAGSTKTVKWQYTGNPGSTVNVDLLKNGTSVKTIASNVSIGSNGNGTYSWKLGISRTPGIDYQIRVTSLSNSAYTDTSDNFFTITGPIIVTSPNGGENWRRGTSHTITWSKAGSSGSYVKIELLRNGSVVKTITSSTSNDGSYSWPISSTQTIASDYQIRITSTSNSAYKDTSDNFFTIST